MRARGAALLLVIWLIALLTALVGGFALAARIEHMQGLVLSRGVVAGQAARAGVEYGLSRVSARESTLRWLADGRRYRWRFADVDVEVRITDEVGKVDLNAAGATLLAGLFRAVGSEPDAATRIASAIVDWRDQDLLTQPQGGAEDPEYAAAGRHYGAKDAPFETVAELEQVLGMTPQLFAKVVQYLTVYTGRGEPDTTVAPAPVLTAMGLDGPALVAARQRPMDGAAGIGGLVGGDGGTYSVESRAHLREGREVIVRSVVRQGGNGLPGSAYTTLDWQEGAATR
ncbi:MAG TPA: type II secretion system minor pseudopilin GspK [Luteimonas sp.]|nr:type II secretion system minor pseudopilin GspK [Luteimonas sp.]